VVFFFFLPLSFFNELTTVHSGIAYS